MFTKLWKILFHFVKLSLEMFFVSDEKLRIEEK